MTDEIEESPASEPTALAPVVNPDLRWYVVHAYSGMEKAVERNILERINRAGMQDKFGRILVPLPNANSSRGMCWSRWSWTTTPGT